MITITAAAIAKLKEIAETEGLPPVVRVGVRGSGCAGFSYDMYFEEKPVGEMDETLEQDGITIVVDSVSLQYLDGTEIDYVDSLMQSGFKFNNPKQTGSCGCGSSFSV